MASDYEAALRFYSDALGLPVGSEWELESGDGAILDAGRATPELLSVPRQGSSTRGDGDSRRHELWTPMVIEPR